MRIEDPGRFLQGLNDQQRAAAEQSLGPVVIRAGAGTGKTRVITHRAAYAAATGAMDPAGALLVTFTKKAAEEMHARLLAMGVRGAVAATFHSAALRQLRYFWPQVHGYDLDVLDSSWRAVNPLVRSLPGHYRFTATQDVVDTISWIKSRRISLESLESAAAAADRHLPIPVDLMQRLYTRYEAGKEERRLVDYDDMILRCIDLLTEYPEVREQVQRRYRWFSVDEFQDTNPAQYELLQLWLGASRDVCVVGDENQTIYTFTGATSVFLTEFSREFPDAQVFTLSRNYRSTPEVLALANTVIAAHDPHAIRLTTDRESGPAPTIQEYPDEDSESRAVAAQVRAWAAAGVPLAQIAILVRLNADTAPIEAALAAAGLPYHVKGKPFYQRREIRAAIRALTSTEPPDGASVSEWATGVLEDQLGYQEAADPETPQEREQHAALTALVQIVTVLAHTTDWRSALTELQGRLAADHQSEGDVVTIATLHTAKGLEWDAVILPGQEDGHLPVQQALNDPHLLAEERRLLYVGITRAREFLLLTWARTRPVPGKPDRRRKPSRFLVELQPAAPTARPPRAAKRSNRAAEPGSDDDLFERLRGWRSDQSREAGIPPYVVLPDSSLWQIAQRKPITLDELDAVYGIGPAKLERYGDELLAMVAQFRHDHP